MIFAITVHEAAHGYVARLLGDDTAYVMGRITLNPVKHIDPVGTIAVPLLILFASGGQFAFGYAKPVPVNFNRLRHPKRDMIWVALAGPASNFIQAIAWTLFLIGLAASGIHESFFVQMGFGGVMINLAMWAFNLFPIPPLDGGRVLAGVLPRGQAQVLLARIEPFGFFVVMALVLTRVIDQLWMAPLMAAGHSAISALLSPVISLVS